MTPEQRVTAAALFWEDDQSVEQQAEAIGALASHMKFRTKSVLALTDEKRARYLASLPVIPEAIAARALVAYHLVRQRPMMSAFLDDLGIKHEDGLIADDATPAPDAARLTAAGTALNESFPPQEVSLYLSTLVSQDPDTWGALADLVTPAEA